jgi:prepilin peptidase CpaA
MNIESVLSDIIMGLMLLVAVVFDQRERRIPNVLILVALILGTGWNTFAGSLDGLLFSIKGLLAGIALLFIPFAMGGMGAGDVKLLGVVGAFKGALFAFHTFIFMALWGGLIAVILLIAKGELGKTLHRLWAGFLLALFKVQKMKYSVEASNSGVYFPYALAIALGAVSAYFSLSLM